MSSTQDSADVPPDVARFHADALVLDIHTHPRGCFPGPVRGAARLFLRNTMPRFRPLHALARGGLDAAVLMAAGGRTYTQMYPLRDPLSAVRLQLKRILLDLRSAGGRIAATAAEFRTAKASGVLAGLPGIEGGDAVGARIEVLDTLYEAGVRVMGLLTYHDNAMGTVGADLGSILGRRPAPEALTQPAAKGLTAFGERVVKRMNEKGMVVDLAHADGATIRDAAGLSSRPVIVSHGAARAVHEWSRHLSDDDIRAVAGTGGLIGLWPMHLRGNGIPDLDGYARQARYIVDLAGEDHLAVGTDMHACPGLMTGYLGITDAPVITRALFDAGLSESQVRKALAENFLRVLRDVVGE